MSVSTSLLSGRYEMRGICKPISLPAVARSGLYPALTACISLAPRAGCTPHIHTSSQTLGHSLIAWGRWAHCRLRRCAAAYPNQGT